MPCAARITENPGGETDVRYHWKFVKYGWNHMVCYSLYHIKIIFVMVCCEKEEEEKNNSRKTLGVADHKVYAYSTDSVSMYSV